MIHLIEGGVRRMAKGKKTVKHQFDFDLSL